MSDELLDYLKVAGDRNWLKIEQNELKSTSEFCSQKLYLLVKAKLAQISILSNQQNKIVIFIAEDDALNFISAFLAGIIAKVNLFLCNPHWQQREWRQVLKLVQPDLIFGSDRVKSSLDLLRLNQERATATKTETVGENAESLIMIPTGGTSGKIKFAMHNWQTLSASVTGFQEFFGCSTINSYCTLPLYHVSGLMQLMRSLLTQGDLIICSYKSIRGQMDDTSSDYFISLVPTQLQYLLETVPDCLKKFKTVLLGGAPASQSVLARARKHQIAIATTYGMTETASGVVILKPKDFLAGDSSNGEVLPHAEVLIDASDNLVESNSVTTKTGLIKINCASLCQGYYPYLFPAAQPLITDDLGYFDERGYLYLRGRNSHKIITGGVNVFPLEVEAAISATKLVRDVCIVGVADPRWGEAVTAIYVPDSQYSLESIKQQIETQIAKYKQPKNWIEVDRIPRNNRGKVNYQQLEAIAMQKLASRLE